MGFAHFHSNVMIAISWNATWLFDSLQFCTTHQTIMEYKKLKNVLHTLNIKGNRKKFLKNYGLTTYAIILG